MTANGPGEPHLTVARGEAADIPDDPQALAEDIERTRQQVGDTVAALTAKLDVQAQLRNTAGRMKTRVGDVRNRVGDATSRAGDAGVRAVRAAGGPRVAAAGAAAVLIAVCLTWMLRRR